MSGNGNKTVVINAGGTALTVTAAALALAVAFTTAGSGGITLTSAGATNVTLPTTGTLATLAGVEELDNKTLDAAVAKGAWTASGTWTVPALTLGGTVSSNGQSFSGTLANLGTVTTADINGGTIDGAVIGGAAAAAGTFTTGTFSGVVTANAGISVPTGFNVTGAGTAQVTGFATVSATTLTGTLSTASQTNVTGLGTVTTGVWNATDIAVADGGTGSSTASGARTNLGLVIGTDVQAQDSELSAIAGLTSAADQLPYFTGSGTAALATFTATARSLLDDASVADMHTTLGVPSGSGSSTGTNTGDNPGVTSVGATAPIASSGGTTPTISITAATGAAAGSMSAADKTKLDAISGTNTGDQTAATQADQEAASSTTSFVSPGRQHFHPGSLKGWVKAGVAANVVVSHNVTSVTDVGAGIITVTWATDFSGADYVAGGTVQRDAVGNVGPLQIDVTTAPTAGETTFKRSRNDGTLEDPTFWHLWAMGDQ